MDGARVGVRICNAKSGNREVLLAVFCDDGVATLFDLCHIFEAGPTATRRSLHFKTVLDMSCRDEMVRLRHDWYLKA